MPTVAELTAVYGNFMLNPGGERDVCRFCFNLTDGYDRCYACAHVASQLDAFAPISYSVGGRQLHHVLAQYKRMSGPVGRRLALELAAVLWRWIAEHERCLARATGVEEFELVATVPSGSAARDDSHPLREIVAEMVGPTRTRHERLLRRSAREVEGRVFDARKFVATRPVSGQSVLLIDDTWTTGANAQSAAAALREAGAGTVAAAVLGRHINPEWHNNDQRLRQLPRPFDWSRCVLCGEAQAAAVLRSSTTS